MLECKIPCWFHKNAEARPDIRQLLIVAIGSFTGISMIAFLSLENLVLLLPSFGASAVLLFAARQVPMARPRNVFWGHLISAAAGVSTYWLWGANWWSLALGVTLAILGMLITDTLHPPGGATAFTAVLTHQGLSFIMTPVAMGVVWLLVVAKIVHFCGQPRKKTELADKVA